MFKWVVIVYVTSWPRCLKKIVCINKSSYITVGFSLECEAVSWKTKLPTKNRTACLLRTVNTQKRFSVTDINKKDNQYSYYTYMACLLFFDENQNYSRVSFIFTRNSILICAFFWTRSLPKSTGVNILFYLYKSSNLHWSFSKEHFQKYFIFLVHSRFFMRKFL